MGISLHGEDLVQYMRTFCSDGSWYEYQVKVQKYKWRSEKDLREYIVSSETHPCVSTSQIFNFHKYVVYVLKTPRGFCVFYIALNLKKRFSPMNYVDK
jgi:hypothetical protein